MHLTLNSGITELLKKIPILLGAELRFLFGPD